MEICFLNIWSVAQFYSPRLKGCFIFVRAIARAVTCLLLSFIHASRLGGLHDCLPVYPCPLSFCSSDGYGFEGQNAFSGVTTKWVQTLPWAP